MQTKIHAAFERAVEAAGRQSWIDDLAGRAQDLIASSYDRGGSAGHKLKDVLHGTWLGHPLHPVLTDVPIGFWTTSAILEVLEIARFSAFRRAVDTTMALGLISALGTAAAGATDWIYMRGRARRIGAVHGIANLLGAGLYACSLLCRARGNRGAGRVSSLLGFAMLNMGAFLGGHLVFAERAGTDHAPRPEQPQQFTRLLPESELREGEPRSVELDGVPILLVRTSGRVYALAEQCSHLGGPLSEGQLSGEEIICPWHGSRFSLVDGLPSHGPTAFRQPCYDVLVKDGWIEVRAE